MKAIEKLLKEKNIRFFDVKPLNTTDAYMHHKKNVQ